ncbi:MAG TPA: isoaspartyl peptidase/L-asparaginase, partial [Solirubrobacteraceae bacterium]|nr:isoaspartyl peptidase/L-asparaginase [Solirubrobacteraceae bacterium]
MGARAAPILIVHGGAGRGRPHADAGADAQLRRDLARAVEAGWRQLTGGAEAACVAAVRVLEECPLFNAGTGSALAADGAVWCDASLMCGDGRAGAVAALHGIRHPITAAQALAHAGGAPLLWSGRSDELAALHGVEQIDPARMVTERQRRRLERSFERDRERQSGGRSATGGTVGAVCLDAAGALAAATSTGGYVGKPPARIGDSAIVGAGTWADARTCAVSATGDGEAFMRVLFAHEIHARMLHAGEGLPTAAAAALAAVGEAGGLGGAICVGVDGTIAMPVSSEVMA